MPSPICEVKNGASAYQSTANGVNVTPGNTITIRLIDSSARTWSIQCVYTDDQSDAATVTSGLVIDPVLRTATFTAPAAGRAYIFQSVINGGVGPDGRAKSTYTTTLGVYTLTAGGARVLAANETTEGDSTFGWTKPVNNLIRSGGGGATPGGSKGDGQFNDGAGGLDASSKVRIDAGGYPYIDDAELTAPVIKDRLFLQGTGAGSYEIVGGNAGTTDKVVTMPAIASSDEVAFCKATQQLEAKTLLNPLLKAAAGAGNPAFRVHNPAGTFEYQWVPSAITAARKITIPLLTADDTLVMAAFAQTLTNKTINASNNTISNIANTHVSTSAAIAGTKIAPDFGTQNVTTTGDVNGGASVSVGPVGGEGTVISHIDAGWIGVSHRMVRQTVSTFGVFEEWVSSVTTTDASIQTVFTNTVLTNSVTTYDVRVVADKGDSTEGDAWVGTVTLRSKAGVISVVSAASITKRGSSAWAVSFNTSSTFDVRVTGAAATTVKWVVQVSVATCKQS